MLGFVSFMARILKTSSITTRIKTRFVEALSWLFPQGRTSSITTRIKTVVKMYIVLNLDLENIIHYSKDWALAVTIQMQMLSQRTSSITTRIKTSIGTFNVCTTQRTSSITTRLRHSGCLLMTYVWVSQRTSSITTKGLKTL
jgi:hypothetical protein